jgi:hypothetical protein
MAAGGSPELVRESAQTACGDGTSFCAEALQSDYETVMRADPCAIQALTDFNRASEDYVLWMPKYRRKACEGSGYLNCSADTERFGPRQVTQESFLQGRGQVTSNRSCPAGFVNYLPASQFGGQKEPKQTDMTLFAQPTLVPRSCGTLTEVDMQARIDALPGAWQVSWSPFVGMQFADPESDPRAPNLASRARKTVTLGSRNKYPDWGELKQLSEPYTR